MRVCNHNKTYGMRPTDRQTNSQLDKDETETEIRKNGGREKEREGGEREQGEKGECVLSPYLLT